MDQAELFKKPGKFPPRKLTVEDVIEWQTRLALKSGPAGFSRDLGGPEQMFKHWEVETSQGVELVDTLRDAPSLMEAAGRPYQANEPGDAIPDLIKKEILDKDKRLQLDTWSEIRRRLLKAGKTQQEIDEEAAHKSSLMEMARYLHNVEHPSLKTSARVKVFLMTGFRGTDKLTPAYLPPLVGFSELHLQLREFVYSKAEESGKAVTATDDMRFLAAWKYKMSKFGKKIYEFTDTSWTKLESALDYRRMVQRVKKSEAQGSVPILVPTHPIMPQRSTRKRTKSQLAGGPVSSEGQSSVESSQYLDPVRDSAHVNVSDVGGGVEKVDQIPEGMEELLEGTEPVDWADLTRRYEAGEDIFAWDW